MIRACRPRWLAQRGPAGVPGERALAQVERLTALALRHAGPSELLVVLTQMVASAGDLPRVLAWRLARIVGAADGARNVPADEDGAGYAAMLAARCAAVPRSAETAAALARARADAARADARLRGGHAPARPPRGHLAIVAEQVAEGRARRARAAGSPGLA